MDEFDAVTSREVRIRLDHKVNGVDRDLRNYLLVAGVLFLLLLVQTLNQQWSSDFWVHLATVVEVADRPWNPMQPVVGASVPDPLLFPFALVLGLITRWSSFDAVIVLATAGLVNLVLWLYGFRRFVLELTNVAGAPVWALLVTLLAWGIQPWRWSGYTSLNSIGFGLPWPSMFATALSL